MPSASVAHIPEMWSPQLRRLLGEQGLLIDAQRQQTTRYHCQPGIEISIVREGQALFRCPYVERRVGPSDLLVYHGHVAHQYQALDEEFRRTVVCFDDRRLGSIRAGGMDLLDVAWFARVPLLMLRLTRSAGERVRSLAERLEREVALQRTGWREACFFLVGELWLRVRRLAETNDAAGSPVSAEAPGLVKRCCDYVVEHLDGDLSLARVSEFAGISPEHLTRLFAAELGIPFHRYVRGVRIHQARSYLRDWPDRSILEISLEVGFQSASHFSRAFREQTGMTPSAYRKHAQGGL